MTTPEDPHGHDGTGYSPPSGSTPTQQHPSSGGFAVPGNAAAPAYQQPPMQNPGYGAPAYGPPPQSYPPQGYPAQGYPAQGYPAPGFPAQGFPGYGYGYGPPRTPKRPGIATGTGVTGIILGIQMFPYAAATLIGAAGMSDNPTEYGRGLVPILWIVGVVAVVAAVTLFVGAIQLLSGSNVVVVRLGALLAVAAIWILTVWALLEFTEIDQGQATIVTIAVLLTILPSTVLGLSLSPTISAWFSKKRAFRAAGLDDN